MKTKNHFLILDGFSDDATVARLYDKLDFQRAGRTTGSRPFLARVLSPCSGSTALFSPGSTKHGSLEKLKYSNLLNRTKYENNQISVGFRSNGNVCRQLQPEQAT